MESTFMYNPGSTLNLLENVNLTKTWLVRCDVGFEAFGDLKGIVVQVVDGLIAAGLVNFIDPKSYW